MSTPFFIVKISTFLKKVIFYAVKLETIIQLSKAHK